MSNQPWYMSHAETITQNVVGLLIGFLILHMFDLPLHTSLQIQVTFFVVSYVRSYLIRRAFNKLKGE